jgi:hypothetical protein
MGIIYSINLPLLARLVPVSSSLPNSRIEAAPSSDEMLYTHRQYGIEPNILRV